MSFAFTHICQTTLESLVQVGIVLRGCVYDRIRPLERPSSRHQYLFAPTSNASNLPDTVLFDPFQGRRCCKRSSGLLPNVRISPKSIPANVHAQHTSQQEPSHANRRLATTHHSDAVLGDVFIHVPPAVSSTKGHGLCIGANGQLCEVCRAISTPSLPTELNPGKSLWPPLRMANFVFNATNTLMILDKSLAVLGVTMQAGSDQHVSDLVP